MATARVASALPAAHTPQLSPPGARQRLPTRCFSNSWRWALIRAGARPGSAASHRRLCDRTCCEQVSIQFLTAPTLEYTVARMRSLGHQEPIGGPLCTPDRAFAL